jgi:hypothetical protein
MSTTISHMFSQLDSTIPYSAWAKLGSDIDSELVCDESGYSVSLSADGQTVAIGAKANDAGNANVADNRGHVRIYQYDANKTVAVTDQTSATFGPVGWNRLGSDIDGEATGDQSGWSVSLSANGRTVAIGANLNDGNGADSGHVRIYQYAANKTVAVTDQTSATFGPIGWNRVGSDINGEAAADQSGFSVSLSANGETVAIGAKFNDGNGANSGHVRIFQFLSSGWTQLGGDIDGEAAGDESGTSVSLSTDGRTVAIGAYLNDGTGTSTSSGHVRIYTYNGTTWSKLGSDIDGETANDWSGWSVSLSANGRTVAIGAVSNDAGNANADNRGHVRIYSYNGSAWIQLGLDIDGEAAGDESGRSVSLSANGRTVAIGATYNNGVNGVNSGHVRIYSYNGSAWIQLGLDIDGEAAGDYSGNSVSLSANGRTVAIGAIGNVGSLGTNSGHVRIYNIKSSYDTSSTITIGAVFSEPVNITSTPALNVLTNIDGTTKLFSYASGTGTNVLYFTKTIIAGEIRDPLKILSSTQPTLTSGTIKNSASNDAVLTLSSDITFHSTIINAVSPTISHMFSQLDSTIPYSAWAQLGQDIDGEAAADQSGRSVSLSADGRTVAIGAIENDGTTGTASDNRGQVRIYSYSAGSWTKLGSDIDGEAAADYSGFSVSLSADGRIVAIGAIENDGNGSNSGHVRIYSYNGNAWIQLGSNINGAAASDQSGYSVSLSADGRTVAIGAIGNDGNGSNSGHVRIYSYNGNAWIQLGSDINGEATGDESGYSVSLSTNGRIVAIGANLNDGNGADSGHVRIYQYAANKTVAVTDQTSATFGPVGWNRVGSDIDGEAAADQSGRSVSLSADGRTVAIGAYLNDGNGSNSGHVRIYSYSSSSWTRLGSDIDGEAGTDQSGWSVSLSDDGRTVAIGAIGNDGNGSNSGHVRIYSYSSSTWSQLRLDIDGEAADDWSGYSMSLSADGRTVAIGSIGNDGNGSGSGHVRIYNINSMYIVNDTITIGAVFSEPVTVNSTTPRLNVLTNIDGTTKQFSYASGDGTNVLYFTKTITTGENIDPLKILRSTQPTLTSGTIKNSSSIDALLTISSDITFNSTIIATNPLILNDYVPTEIDNIVTPTINLMFSEKVYINSGNVTVKRISDNVTIQTIDIASFTISGTNASYTLTNALKYNEYYYINLDASTIINYAGVSDNTSLIFSTKKLYSSSLYENGRWENPEYLDTSTGNKRMFGGGNKKYSAPSNQGRPSVMFSITAKRTSTKNK